MVKIEFRSSWRGILVKAEAMLQYIERIYVNSEANEQRIPTFLTFINFPDVVTYSVVDYSTKG